MRPRGKDRPDQGGSLRADLLGPPDEAVGAPFRPLLMGFGHVVFDGGVLSLFITADMAGNPLVLIKAFSQNGPRFSSSNSPRMVSLS